MLEMLQNGLKILSKYRIHYVAAVGLGAVLGYLLGSILLKKGNITEDGSESFPETDDVVRSQFSENAAVFSGLYEAVYRIGKGERRFRQGVAGDFVVRLNGINGAAELNERLKFLSGYDEWDNDTGVKKMKELTEFFFGNGVIRDSSDKITVNSETYANYEVADGERLYEGTIAEVKIPCWHIDTKLLEKGIIQKKEEADNVRV